MKLASERDPKPPRWLTQRRQWVWWVAWGTATVFVLIFLRTFDLRAAVTYLKQTSPGWIIFAVVAQFTTLPLMTEQWIRLLPRHMRTRWSAMWECVAVAMASMNTLPFAGGHAVAVGLLASRGITSVSGGVSLLALEQICEGVAKVVLLIVALAVAPLPDVLKQATWVLTIATIAGFLALLWVATHPTSGPGASGWRARWGRHLEILRRPGAFFIATAFSVAMKFFGLVAIYAVHRSLGVDLPLSSTPLILAAVTFATMMSVAPGNVGLYELAAIAAYRLLGVPAGQAAALALVLHASFLLPMIGTGYGWMVWRALRPAPERASESVVGGADDARRQSEGEPGEPKRCGRDEGIGE